MDKYKKILKLLKEGKTLQVLVEDMDYTEDYDRLRVLHKNKSDYTWIVDNGCFQRSCFTKETAFYSIPRTPEQLVERMKYYDKTNRLEIKAIRVV